MRLGLSLALMALLPVAAAGQHWSADEQSLVDAVGHCWDVVNEDISTQAVLANCHPVDGAIYWWTPETAPYYFVSKWTDGLWSAFEMKLISQDLRPLRVQVVGDFGFIYFHGIRLYETPTGTRETESWKGMEVWKRTNGTWGYFGGTGTPDALDESG